MGTVDNLFVVVRVCVYSCHQNKWFKYRVGVCVCLCKGYVGTHGRNTLRKCERVSARSCGDRTTQHEAGEKRGHLVCYLIVAIQLVENRRREEKKRISQM